MADNLTQRLTQCQPLAHFSSKINIGTLLQGGDYHYQHFFERTHMSYLRIQPMMGYGSMLRGLRSTHNAPQRTFVPAVEIIDGLNNVVLHAELPGVAKEDVTLSIHDGNVLTLKGSKPTPEYSEGTTVARNERITGSFSRSFILPDNIDASSVTAQFTNGILTVVVGKVQPETPAEITVPIQ
jgi:HSP20 family protein